MITLMRDGSPKEIAIGLALGGVAAAVAWSGLVYGILVWATNIREKVEGNR